MRLRVVPLLLALCLAPITHAAAQPTPAHAGTPPSEKYKAQKPDQELRRLLREIDQRQLSATVQKLVSFGTRHTLSSQTDPVRGIGAATQWVYQQLQSYAAASGGQMTVELQSFVQPVTSNIPTPTVITNVLARLRGSQSPARTYLVSAHIDTRVTDVLNFDADQPGADDDASGVAVVLELARVMAGRVPEATIVFAVVAGQEQGNVGSTFLATQLKATAVDLQGMFTNDIVGSSTAQDGTRDAREIRLFTEGVPTAETPADANLRRAAGGEDDGSSRQLARFVKSVAENDETDMTVWLINRRDRMLRTGDQVSFLNQGFPAARFTEPNENFAHEHQDTLVQNGVQLGDLVSFLDFTYLTRVARVNAAAIWSLAVGPGTPKNLQLSAVPPSNMTNLSWDPGGEPDLVGYEVVWREMDDADWTHVVPVGNLTTVSFPFFPKDNFLVGVRAVDRAGHHSPVAYPKVVAQ